ncbi:Beta-fructofuranosidase [Planctomycetales bacterium 10988]|nr:Beta-fructofuranosidase [Planctomycetales bacterium 10988]
MYSETEGSRKSMGDVDVIYHDGLFHLFHLVLPNHDFIAHAVSEDGLTWQRVNNALFIGHPGSWDDSMLWTVHVSLDPFHEGKWRMFYTGLSRNDRGLKQRLGLATSEDLFHWEKAPVSWQDHRQKRKQLLKWSNALEDTAYDPKSSFPISPDPEHYEASVKEGRHWVSWRDPFYYREGNEGWLLCAGRIKQGPITRRGCVAVMKEVAPNQFEAQPALFHPGQYDDIEVPNLICIENEYYLIGSIREDAKIRYWHTDAIDHPWRSYYDNVILAQGNYAARICSDDKGYLIWNFFTQDVGFTQNAGKGAHTILPPPKRLIRRPNGMLGVCPFEKIVERVKSEGKVSPVTPLKCSYSARQISNHEPQEWDGNHLRLQNKSGFEIFVFPEEANCFRLKASLQLCGLGKCGIVFRLNKETRDGYYLSLDLTKGVAQLRSWGTGPEASGENMMHFDTLQSGYWFNETPDSANLELLVFGSYIELSVEHRVVLSMADQTYSDGQVGIYVESSTIDISDLTFQHLHPPVQSDEHLTEG